ncbi:XRE family transcriptional regulator [Aeromicrobium sp. Root495]|uniref:helix-turn-helix transcriptional regulator n=1 Tax=Aeromicrobium sp. Root495 TaxID=1736550 RepID=UPI000700EC47|nr:helix-turn-helix transcriptional regulator [Aeromicrobium sp. Root495]KQY60547.1 XRE family transcriptional regulator [Aeromicrobium sp. Root495]
MDRSALAEFLRSRRETLQPEDVGIPEGPRRRAPGLRREDVAQLAAMSTDYYTRLEQQRGPQPSVQILASLARALRLSLDERDYLYRTAGHHVPDRGTSSEHVAPALLRVLDRLSDTPSLIISDLGVTLVQNSMATALFGPATSATGAARAEVVRWFLEPDTERRRYPTDAHDHHGRALVSGLRVVYGEQGAASPAGEIVRLLTERSPEFVALWERQEVARRFQDHKTVLHPQVGAIELDCQALFTEDRSQALLTLTAAPHSEAESQLSLLAVLGAPDYSVSPTT